MMYSAWSWMEPRAPGTAALLAWNEWAIHGRAALRGHSGTRSAGGVFPMAARSQYRRELLRQWLSYLPLSDRQFYEVMYFRHFHRRLRLDPPVTFNEKIQWLKLHDRDPIYTTLADKYAVRDYVASRIGTGYLNGLYGVFDHEYDIDFQALPDTFVLKATHGSGWNIFCRDKSQFDFEAAGRRLRKWLATNFYRVGRDPQYRAIPPKVICEHLLADDERETLLDYKFFCFGGRVKLVQVDFDRYTNHTRNMYDRDWVQLPFDFNYPCVRLTLNRPRNLQTMVDVAETLAGEMPFVRVDLYDVGSRILFGELTFTPESGYGAFEPPVWDYVLGSYIDLPRSR
jgi:hypothetical protein